MKSKVLTCQNILLVFYLLQKNFLASTSTLVNEFVHIKVHIPTTIERPKHIVHVSSDSSGSKVIHHYHGKNRGPGNRHPLAKHAGLLESILSSEVTEPLSSDHYKYLHNVREIASHIDEFSVKPLKAKHRAKTYDVEETKPKGIVATHTVIENKVPERPSPDYDALDGGNNFKSKGHVETYHIIDETKPREIVETYKIVKEKSPSSPNHHDYDAIDNGYNLKSKIPSNPYDVIGPREIINTYEIAKSKDHSKHHHRNHFHSHGDEVLKYKPKSHSQIYEVIEDSFDDYQTNSKDTKNGFKNYKIAKDQEFDYSNDQSHSGHRSTIYDVENDFTQSPGGISDGYQYSAAESAKVAVTKIPRHHQKQYSNSYSERPVEKFISKRPLKSTSYYNTYQHDSDNEDYRSYEESQIDDRPNLVKNKNKGFSSGYKSNPNEDVPDEPMNDYLPAKHHNGYRHPTIHHYHHHYRHRHPHNRVNVRTNLRRNPLHNNQFRMGIEQTGTNVPPTMAPVTHRIPLQSNTDELSSYGPNVQSVDSIGYQYSPPFL